MGLSVKGGRRRTLRIVKKQGKKIVLLLVRREGGALTGRGGNTKDDMNRRCPSRDKRGKEEKKEKQVASFLLGLG